jgi:hypothetical protein
MAQNVYISKTHNHNHSLLPMYNQKKVGDEVSWKVKFQRFVLKAKLQEKVKVQQKISHNFSMVHDRLKQTTYKNQCPDSLGGISHHAAETTSALYLRELQWPKHINGELQMRSVNGTQIRNQYQAITLWLLICSFVIVVETTSGLVLPGSKTPKTSVRWWIDKNCQRNTKRKLILSFQLKTSNLLCCTT